MAENCGDDAFRFWKLVTKGEGCWTWTGGTSQHGYGRFWLRDRMVQAHRAAWLFVNGGIPAGLFVCHKCDNPGRVNPDHLFLGTQLDNMRDCATKGRITRVGRPRQEEECRRGHPFVPENTIYEGGQRKCRACRNAGLRRRRALARLARASRRGAGR